MNKNNAIYKLWIFLGLPTILVSAFSISNLYKFYLFNKLKPDCGDIYSKQVWNSMDFLCFSPNSVFGSIWGLAFCILILLLLLRYTRRNLKQ